MIFPLNLFIGKLEGLHKKFRNVPSDNYTLVIIQHLSLRTPLLLTEMPDIRTFIANSEYMTISKGSKKVQTKILLFFSLVLVLLLVATIVTRNNYFLYSALFVLVIFVPLFSYCLKFHDITVQEGYFDISNLESTFMIRSFLFRDVSPSVTIFHVAGSSFYAIHFFNGTRFNFVNDRTPKKFFRSPSFNAEDIDKMVRGYLELTVPHYTALHRSTSLSRILIRLNENDRMLIN